MKILVVCHRVPFPPKRGGKIRPFNIIRHLSSSGHEVAVASLARNSEELADAEGLRQHCARSIVEIVPDAVMAEAEDPASPRHRGGCGSVHGRRREARSVSGLPRRSFPLCL